MYITKLGHCCLLIKIGSSTILTDPGTFSTSQNEVAGVDLILITHQHADHLHIESLQLVLKNNPSATVVTNSSVGILLDEKGITHTLLEGTTSINIKNLKISAFDAKHEEVWQEMASVQNTGYMIDDLLYYPGDSFSNPGAQVKILALPVAGPWCRIRDAIAYALKIKPEHTFPVHDGMLQNDKVGSAHFAPSKVLSENEINFVAMNAGDSHEF